MEHSATNLPEKSLDSGESIPFPLEYGDSRQPYKVVVEHRHYEIKWHFIAYAVCAMITAIATALITTY